MSHKERIKHKRGDKHPDTGFVFWHYANPRDTKGLWITQARMNELKLNLRENRFKGETEEESIAKKQRHSESMRQYYLKNKERILLKTSNYYDENKANIIITKIYIGLKGKKKIPCF